MNRRQIAKLSEVLDRWSFAILIASVADLLTSRSQVRLDIVGCTLGIILMLESLRLTGRTGGG